MFVHWEGEGMIHVCNLYVCVYAIFNSLLIICSILFICQVLPVPNLDPDKVLILI